MLSLILMGGANSVKAKTLDVDLSGEMSYDSNVTWTWDGDAKKGHFVWTGTWSNAMIMPGLSGNLSDYTTVNWNVEEGTGSDPVKNHFRILIYYSNSAAQTTYNPYDGGDPVDMTGEHSVTFAEMGVNSANLAYVASIKISGAAHGNGDVYLKSFSLTGPDVVPIEASIKNPSGTIDLNELKGTYSGSNWASSITYPKVVANETVFCGNGDGSNESDHVTISDYDYINFVVTDASADASTGLRVWIWDGKVVTLYPNPISEASSVENWEDKYFITSPGVYSVKISDYDYLKGMKALQSWAGNDGNITISQSYLSKGTKPVYSVEYAFIGKENTGAASLTAALADANAVYYDATGVTGTSVDLTSVTNYNALFKANSGVLTNTDNVIISGNCANLVLKDGNYSFRAPETFTATSASYDRAFTKDQLSTVCLPFVLTAEEAATAGTFYELTAYNEGTLTFTEVDGATEAYKPYLFKAAATAKPFTSYSGKTVGATPVDLDVTAGDATMTGTMAHQSVNGKYGWNSTNGEFSKATSAAVTIDPFRAYITISGGSSPARVAARFVGGSVTGISEVSEAKKVMNADSKFIENGKIVILKNGVKYNAAGAQIK